MKTFHLSFQGYNDKGELILSGAGNYEGVNSADVLHRLEKRLKLNHPEAVRFNINNHGYTETK